ncbi:MAG: hypothetical protein ACI4F1_13000 [Bariatricus sp.]
MHRYIYDIVLETPIGDRKGNLVLKGEEEEVEGFCTLLGFTQPCSGEIGRDGRCRLRGQLKTFMTRYDYIGTGYADQDKIDLILRSGGKKFYMTGTAVKPEDL